MKITFFHRTNISVIGCIFFFLISNSIFAQFYVVDSTNLNPISFAHVNYNNQGIITNEDGFFKLPSNIKNSQQNLTFSHISYKIKSLPANKLTKNDTIYLIPSPIILSEVLLENISPKEILSEAIKKIDSNYFSIPYNIQGLSRHSLQENSIGVEMIEVDFTSYIDGEVNNTKINEAKVTKNYSKYKFETYGGAASIISEGDLVRRKIDFLNIKNIDHYSLSDEGTIKENNRIIYKIAFKPKDENDLNFLRQGILYIDSISKAFIRIEYEFDNKKLKEIVGSENGKSNRKPEYLLTSVKNEINYQELSNGKWVLLSIKAKNLIKGIYRNDVNKYTLSANLFVHTVDSKNVIKIKTNYDISKDFSSSVKKYENNEWKDNFRLLMSKNEHKILSDINNKEEDQ